PQGCSPWTIEGKLVDHRDMSGRGGYQRMINNTGLILPPQAGRDGLHDYRYLTNADGSLQNLIPLEGNEHPDHDRIWCQHGIALHDRIILSFIQVRMIEGYTGPMPIGFEIVGSGLATGPLPQCLLGSRAGAGRQGSASGAAASDPSTAGAAGENTPTFRRVFHRGTHILWRAEQPHFGVAFLRRPDDPFVYVYGTVDRNGRQRACLARVPHEQICELSAYEYLAGDSPRWSRSIDDCVVLFDGMPSEISVSFNHHLRAYLAVHSLDLTGQIVARTAPEPWGPWSDPVLLWQVRPSILPYQLPYPFRLIYAGKEHPQLSPDGGQTIYLTYIEFEEYFPHLIEVVLA
ncbi:MAG: DUF4185 domain-containing protein, partial [Phycisphaerales bacterium]|nr:DUF4185 domain-containing protein [Phycisphaerales bacterium]